MNNATKQNSGYSSQELTKNALVFLALVFLISSSLTVANFGKESDYNNEEVNIVYSRNKTLNSSNQEYGILEFHPKERPYTIQDLRESEMRGLINTVFAASFTSVRNS